MKPKSIFLIRHGESTGNVDKTVYHTVPDWKVPLTDKGQLQAFEAGKNLRDILDINGYRLSCNERVDLGSSPPSKLLEVYTSPWYRARQTTANLLISTGLCDTIVKEDPRIREQEWGNYQEGHLQDKIKKERHQYGSFFFRMPHGESGADVYDRVTSFMDTLYRDFDRKDFPANVLISTHGLTIKIFLMRWFHWSVEEFERYDTPDNCAIIRMDLQNDGKYLLRTILKEYTKYVV